jgi:ribosomal protein S27AE
MSTSTWPPVEVEMAADFDRLACERCDIAFPAPEGAALIYGLKARCPSCGGEFKLILGHS